MGTDAHFLVEISHFDQPWKTLWDETDMRDVPRNYVLFSMLADVANRSGRVTRTWQEPTERTLPGGETIHVDGWWYEPDDGGHDPLVPITIPRGIPEDATLAFKAHVAIWEAKGAEPITSWITPADITEGDWEQEVWREGYVFEEDYLLWRDQGVRPETFSSNAGGTGVTKMTAAEYEAGLRGEHTSAIWLRWNAGTAREVCADFLEVMEMLRTIGLMSPTSRIRLMLLFEC